MVAIATILLMLVTSAPLFHATENIGNLLHFVPLAYEFVVGAPASSAGKRPVTDVVKAMQNDTVGIIGDDTCSRSQDAR